MRQLAVVFAIAATVQFTLPATLHAQSSEKVLTTRTFIDVAKKTLPSVVSISIRTPEFARYTNPADPQFEQMMEFFSRFGRQGDPRNFHNSSGSGFIISVEDGKAIVVTNNHVVSSAENNEMIAISLDHSVGTGKAPEDIADSDEGLKIDFGKVRLVGRDELSDLAVLEFDVPEGVKLEHLQFADSDALEVGEWVVALGSPLDYNNSVSQGIISAKGRYLGSSVSIQNLIQTTATINPGNSGGPVVNLDGQIVGIANAIASNNGYWQGIGFAIPGNDVKRISHEIAESGKVSRGYLGIRMAPLSLRPSLAKKYEIEDYNGVIVEEVMRGTPAADAGFSPGDVILRVDGRKTNTTDDLLRAISARAEGEVANFDVVRLDDEGELRKLTIGTKLVARPEENVLAIVDPSRSLIPDLAIPEKGDPELLGLATTANRASGGMEVTGVEPGTPASRAGLRMGDILLRVNGKRVKSGADLQAAFALSIDGSHVITYERDSSQMYTSIETE